MLGTGQRAGRGRRGQDAYADFEVWADELGTSGPERQRLAHGVVRFDGCVDACLERDDGAMPHWCSAEDVAVFGRALCVAREMCGKKMSEWCGG